jgi:hypothetical protein
MSNNDKWVPQNAPNIQQDFAGKPAEKTTDIATKWELEHLILERSNQVRTLDYMPDSLATSKLKEDLERAREGRIRTLQEILDKYKNKSRDSFNMSADDHLLKQDKGHGY